MLLLAAAATYAYRRHETDVFWFSTGPFSVVPQEYSEAEAASAMKRMEQHHAANGWGDDTAQPVDVPTANDSQRAADGVISARHNMSLLNTLKPARDCASAVACPPDSRQVGRSYGSEENI